MIKNSSVFLFAFVWIVLSVCFSSCVTHKQRIKICSTCPTESFTRDSIVVTKYDTTVIITTETTIKYFDNPCADLCDSLGGLKADFRREINNNGIRTVIRVVNDTIVIENNADSLVAIIKGLEKVERFKETQIVSIRDMGKTPFETFTLWYFWISLIIIGGYLFIKFKS